MENDWGPRAGDARLITSVRLSVSLQGRGDRRERERERKRMREKNAMKKEKLIERKHVKGRGSAWTSGSSEYGKPPLRFCPLRRIEGTASPLAGKSRGAGFSQRNAATIKGARRSMLGARRSQSGCLHTEGIQAWIKGA